ncbi:acyl-CoA thioesterase [Arthrobacter sp. 7Tela_A1]|uniref:acyl-CoA thioesterase n=1 Tax=Arthrobacter sp. 7Tela_A1 TaxID=3093745 RepID=UPI003BB65AC7
MTTSSPAIRVKVPMRWSDMDAYGHVNNVEVLRMLEEARILAFGPPAGTGAPGVRPPVALFDSVPGHVQSLVSEHRVKYLAPLEYRNVPADVDLWISSVKGASLAISYRVSDPVTGTACIKAETTLAFVDAVSGRLLRVSEEQRVLVRPHSGASVFS